VHDSLDLASPKVFISYSHDSEEHKERVRLLANRLRQDGVDATIDQYEASPPEGWPVWMERQVRESDFVLVICTETYLKRAERREEPDKGHGVMWESVLTYQQIYDAGSRNEKFIPVLLAGDEHSHIPAPLKSATSYKCTTDDEYKELYRRLTDQLDINKPALGSLKALPPREKKQHIQALAPAGTTVFPTTQRLTPETQAASELWNVPHERNPVFTGRSDILDTLRANLVANGKQALYGLGGIGKTQIAAEYTYRYRHEYKAVLWAFADSEQSLSTSCIQIAKVLDLPVQSLAEQAVIVGAVKRWLEQSNSWLLILDNLDHPEIVQGFLPRQCHGHILLTSRAHVFQVLSIMKPVEVTELPPEAAREFLLKRTWREASSENVKDIDALAAELGYFPLALEQAGAFIYENQASFENYLKSFRKRRLALLGQYRPVIGGYKETVATTWAINFAELEKFPASAGILSLSAFLSPSVIPLELLEGGKAEVGEPLASKLQGVLEDPVLLDELLKPLADYSLIRRNLAARSYSIHPLVQEVIRDNMDSSTQRLWAERTVRAVSAGFPEPEFKNWLQCERLLSHVLLCAKYVTNYNFEFLPAATLMRNAGLYLHERAQYTEAEVLYQRALAMREKAWGQNHPDTADSLNKLAWLYHDQGKYAKSEPLSEHALEVSEKVFGPEHPETATSVNNLAALYHTQGRYEKAESLYKRALTIKERALGSEHADTAKSLNNLAALYRSQGRDEEAEPLYHRALRIREKIHGVQHPDTATGMNNMAMLYRGQGRFGEAEPLCHQALQIKERALGPEHPDTATSLHNLAGIYQAQGRHGEAEPLFQRALAIKEKALGPEHPDVARILHSMARLYRNQGKYRLAEPLFLRAYVIQEAALGPKHPDVIVILQNLALLYRRWGKVREANKYDKILKQMQRKKRR
jgi:tetratricopeptide (TPR) repeat protein